ncbi:UDP-N-acetylmuramoyl-tripeptide--D-alanyl-D-alanine ligase [Flavobacterium sp.]|uniref:UDP-N-acetylmuramoyl-tripeptide--D-alanyl-D- alanine ligase n=1 Tax=Flavobacterium sp. TaxID=239 RepID=UPI00286A7E92|nr:UDP-N-acetylmuramoyl-tripeptide--D-alanyl-D-alanine ligase [Flavobacterium sp.]
MRIEEIYQCFLQCISVSTDTRNIQPNSLFVALKGENFDANTYANEAIIKGALFVIIDDKKYFTNKVKMILVENSLKTLQELATFHRQSLGLQVIALTGSNGKTTTKELIHVVLSKKYNTKATIGNLNNHIGVPLTLLTFNENTDIGIVEMGANHQKEIEMLCSIAKPDFAYISNFGKAHLEGFGGIEGVIKGKSEMYDYIRENNKQVFVNLDDPIQAEKTNTLKSITFGINKIEANLNITSIKADPFVRIKFDDTQITSNLIGLYNANNINAAICIGNFFKVSNNNIKEGIESYVPENNRSQMVSKKTNKIILDAYNANPSSMSLAIENFIQLKEDGKLIIMGDMFELGSETKYEHQEIIKLLEKNISFQSYFVGKYFYENRTNNEYFKFFETFEDLKKYIKYNLPSNKLILIKGSRGMALERIVEFLE